MLLISLTSIDVPSPARIGHPLPNSTASSNELDKIKIFFSPHIFQIVEK